MRQQRGVMVCAMCGKPLDVPSDANVHFGIQGVGGRRNERLIMVDGKELHRCPVRERT